MRTDLNNVLAEKLSRSLGSAKIRRSLGDESVFSLKAYIIPSDVYVVSPQGLPIKVLTVSNSAITLRGDNLGLFLRLGGVNFSRTFIAYAEIPLRYVSGRLKVEAKVILPPILSSECVEDPRLDPVDVSSLYHVRAFYMVDSKIDSLILTFLARLSYASGYVSPEKLIPITFRLNGDEYILPDFRDSFPLSRDVMVVRPWFRDLGIGGIFLGVREGSTVLFKTLRPIPELLPNSEFERKTGANTSLKLSSNEYLLIFHSVEKPHGMYYTYAAILSNDGELLGLTPKPILPPLPSYYSGRRPSTIFVCGALKLKDKIILSTGKDDEVLLILETNIDEILNKIRYIKG